MGRESNEFKEANEAFDNKKYFFLLDIADKYRVSTPRNYDQQNRWMKRETEKIQGLISQKKNSYSYGFAEAETEEEARRLVDEGEVDWHEADYHDFNVFEIKERNDD